MQLTIRGAGLPKHEKNPRMHPNCDIQCTLYEKSSNPVSGNAGGPLRLPDIPLRVLMVLDYHFERPKDSRRSRNYEILIPFSQKDGVKKKMRSRIPGMDLGIRHVSKGTELKANCWVSTKLHPWTFV